MSRLRMSKVILWSGSDRATIERNINVLLGDGYDREQAERIASIVAGRTARGAPASPPAVVGDPAGAGVGG